MIHPIVVLCHQENRALVHAWLRDNNGACNWQLMDELNALLVLYEKPHLRALVMSWVREIAEPDSRPITKRTRWYLKGAA